MKQVFTKRLLFILFAIGYIILSVSTYKDYGVAIDEPIEYRFGEMLYARNFGKDPVLIRDFSIKQDNSREIWAYNHFHAMLLYMVNDSKELDTYHLLNFFFALIGFYIAYELVLYATKKSAIAFLSVLILISVPRFFGDIASNVKDPVFAIYLIMTLFAILLSEKIKMFIVRILMIAIPLGFAAATRLLGYFLIPLYVIYKIRLGTKIFKLILESLSISIVSILVHGLQMPFVAANPIGNLIELSKVARSYPWDGEMLYMGKIISASSLPWHYPIIWIFAVTPLFVLGFWIWSHRYVHISKTIFLLQSAIWLNVVIYIIMRPTIYDGIRHYLFILVLMAILAAIAWYKLYKVQKIRGKIILGSFLVFHLLATGIQGWKLHPYQYVYFNEMFGSLSNASTLFETDYWGTSYREGAEWLKNHITDKDVVVGLCGNREASIYFENTPLHTVWIPRCDNIPVGVNYVFAFGRNNEWDKVPGNVVYSVIRMNVPLMKVFAL